MTEPNPKEGRHVEYKSFKFSKFPLEEEKICVCLISNRKESPELKPMLAYLSLIFPSNSADTINKVAEKPNKNMILNLSDTLDWTDGVALKKNFDRYNNFHILSIGEYEKTPKLLLANADLLIFDNEKDVNDYLAKSRYFHLDGFNFALHFLVIDKRAKDCEICFIERSTLERYYEPPAPTSC
jgi:hypothetical protein